MCYLNKKLRPFPVIIIVITLIAGSTSKGIQTFVINNYTYWENMFWALAFGWSTFLALYAFQLHNRLHADNPDDVAKGYGKLRWSQRIQQFTLNFIGGMIGFVIIYLFVYTDYLNSFAGWEKIILLLIAFLAVMGYLPYTLIIKSWLPSR